MKITAHSMGYFPIPEHECLVLENQVLERMQLSDRRLVQFAAVGSRFLACTFEKLRVERASFGAGTQMSEYTDCKFDGSQFRSASAGRARFVRCSFRDVTLADMFSFTAEFIDCTFSGKLRGVVFNGTVPYEDQASLGRTRNEFRGNDFSEMDLFDVAFRTGIDLEQQRLPSGRDYVLVRESAAVLREVRAAVLNIEDSETRKDALVLVEVLELETQGGQQQLLLNPASFHLMPRKSVDAVFLALRRTARQQQ
jgi:hypothetical protein